ncbi:uncharacterized protein TNCV_2358491 [Trichonephila clavipes]|nr:uncharacterized protein TNCV_2358491 [Trichonephila clavipes]
MERKKTQIRKEMIMRSDEESYNLAIMQNSHISSLGATDGRGSLVDKVTDSWPVCQEFDSRTAEYPPCRGAMHVKSVQSSNVLSVAWCGSLERNCQLRYRLPHLAMVQKDEVLRQNP